MVGSFERGIKIRELWSNSGIYWLVLLKTSLLYIMNPYQWVKVELLLLGMCRTYSSSAVCSGFIQRGSEVNPGVKVTIN